MRASKPWTEQDIEQLRKMRAQGVSPARIAIVLKKSESGVRTQARKLGINFESVLELKKRRLEKEIAARAEAGLLAIPKSLKTS